MGIETEEWTCKEGLVWSVRIHVYLTIPYLAVLLYPLPAGCHRSPGLDNALRDPVDVGHRIQSERALECLASSDLQWSAVVVRPVSLAVELEEGTWLAAALTLAAEVVL